MSTLRLPTELRLESVVAENRAKICSFSLSPRGNEPRAGARERNSLTLMATETLAGASVMTEMSCMR